MLFMVVSLTFFYHKWRDTFYFMLFINGPYNGLESDDLGTVNQKMSIYRPSINNTTEVGVAVYEPSEDRTKTFWLDNLWDGSTLVKYE